HVHWTVGQVAAAETVGTERLSHACRPHFHAAVVDHLQSHSITRKFTDRIGQRIRVARRPVDVHVDALQLHRSSRRRGCRYAGRGAEPWMASNIAHLSPTLADPASPTDPAICAATSLRISPYRFGITMTSKASGVSAILAAPISTIQTSFSISG